jgi:putative SOS response-associated peptidase YedK
MCGRFGFTFDDNTWKRFEIESGPQRASNRYNIAPSQEAVVVTRHSPNKAQLMQFGMLPFWAHENKGYVINARAETVFEKAMFRKNITERRCLVPATFFFEWRRTKDVKIPYAFKVKDEDAFSFAGIYSEVTIDGHEKQSFAIITTQPNAIMRPVHNRMPVILSREEEDEWLNPDIIEPERLEKFLDPFPSEMMEAWKISTLVNKPSNDFKEILKPLSHKTEENLEHDKSFKKTPTKNSK